MAGITIGGLGSGLDTKGIIEALVRVEGLPINALETKKAGEKAKLSLFSTLKGLVDALHTKAKALATKAEFLAFTVSSGDATVASFKASGAAVAGSHTITVNQLATSDRWAFNGLASPTTNLATADGQGVSFTYNGVAYNATVTQAASSLNDVAAAINTAAAGKVSASVVNTGTTASPSYQLVLSGQGTGKDLRISAIASTITALTINATGPTAGGVAQSPNNLTVGNNAIAVIDGLTVERSGNDFNDVLTGVSISTLKADPAKTTSFTVAPDTDAIKAKLAEFVEAYNKVITFIHGQNTFSEDDGAGGALFGDNVLRTIESTIRGELFGATTAQIAGDTAGFGTLKLLGLDLQKDGTLVIDDAKLSAKLAADLTKFADLFVDTDGFNNGGAAIGTPAYYVDISADSGLAEKLWRAIDRVVKGFTDTGGATSKGLFEGREEAINGRIKLFDKQIEDRQFRLDRFQANLEARFAALEATMARLQAQQQYLDSVAKSSPMNQNPSNEVSSSAAAGVYAQANIENAPPVKIVRLLYQGAIRFLDNAAACDLSGPASKFDYWLGRCEDIVVELRIGLDSAPAPEIAASLTDLYLFVEAALARARKERSVEPLAGARAVLAKLLEAWTAIDTSKV